MNVPLNAEEEYRYSRHLILPQVGLHGQERLKSARVLIIGAGGLGSPVALYLAAAGIGTIGICDDDRVEISNLQRQIIHNRHTINDLKVNSAAKAISSLNPYINVIPIPDRITTENVLALIAQYDIIIDGTDNFPTRYLLNDACFMLKKPLIFGSIYQFSGQITIFDAANGPCYRCLYPSPPSPESVPSCAEGGVLGVLPGIIGTLQGLEALKLILQIGTSLAGRLLLFDALTTTFREIRVEKDPDCPLCGKNAAITSLTDYHEFCGVNSTPQTIHEWNISPKQLHDWTGKNSLQIIDIRTEWEVEDMAGLSDSTHIPYTSFTNRMHELDSAKDIVIYCAAGIRSWQMVHQMRQSGFTRVWNLDGGLLRYRQYFNKKGYNK